MAARKEKKVAAYPQDFLRIWKAASKDTLTLKGIPHNTAVSLRQQLYQFRKALGREGFPLALELQSISIHIEKPSLEELLDGPPNPLVNVVLTKEAASSIHKSVEAALKNVDLSDLDGEGEEVETSFTPLKPT